MGDNADHCWDHLVNFVREVDGKIVMHGSQQPITAIQPGSHVGADIAEFRDLPQLRPKYSEISGVQWLKSREANGVIIFPSSFYGGTFPIPVQHATSELLLYYGCTFADVCPDKMMLKAPHAIQGAIP